MPIARYTVQPTDERLRIDRFAVRYLGIASRARARKMLKRDEILLNGRSCESSRFVREGDEIALSPSSPLHKIYERPLSILWSDEHLAAIHKPPGLPVSGHRFKTVQAALPFNLPLSDAEQALPVPRPVHRLDARTSGLLLVARTVSAQIALGRLFQERRVYKRYRALLVGRLEGEGRIDSPIEGRPAASRYVVLDHTPSLHTRWLSTVDLFPESGRTHQLRIHMAGLGHPILGDGRYTTGLVLRGSGMYLFAAELRLPHPISGEDLHFQLPEPAKFSGFRRREARRFAAHPTPPGFEDGHS